MSETIATAKRSGNALILTGLFLGVLLAALDQTVVGTSLPKIVADLHDFEHFAALVTAYLLAATVAVPLAGKFSDTYGRRPVYLLAMGLFLLGSILCGTATTMTQLILFRAIQGLGAGAIFPVAIATVADLYPPAERGRVQGLFGAVFGLSSIIGPFVGGYIVDHLLIGDIASWRWIFYVNIPIGAAALFMVWTHFPRTAPRATKLPIDWAGIIAITLTLVSAVLIAEWGGDGDASHAWGSPTILGLIGIAIVALVSFIFIESRAKDPIIPLALFREPIFAVSAAATLLMGAAMFTVIAFMPTYMQGVVGISATYSGAVIMPLSLSLAAMAIVSGRLMTRWGYKAFILAGTLIASTGFVLLYFLSQNTSPPIWLAIMEMVWIGVGIGCTVQTYIVGAQNAVEKRYVGVGTSTITLMRTLGATIGIAALGAVLNNRMNAELPNDKLTQPALDKLLADPHIAGHVARLPQLLVTPEFMNATFPGHDSIVAGLKEAFSQSISVVWIASAVIAFTAFVVSLFIRSRALKTSEAHGESAAASMGH